jgi:hypothetical protein
MTQTSADPHRQTRPGRMLARLAAVAVTGTAVLTAVTASPAQAATWTQIYNGNTSSAPLTSRVLTPDGAAALSIAKAGGTVTMTAPVTSHAASNLREVFWPAGAASQTDQETCATWASQSDDRAQEGLALRITDISGDVRALTVTKNVIYGVWWDFNVHTWDSQASQPFTQIAQFDYSAVVITGGSAETPFPWRACARATGATLTFKLWVPALEAEPSWSDPAYVHSTTIPSGYLNAGQAGWYIGHVPAGGAVTYTRLGLWAG